MRRSSVEEAGMARGFRDEDEIKQVAFEDVTCLRETDKALLCLIEGEEVWVPQSQITDDSEVYEQGGEGKLVVTTWWAAKQGLA
jgi:hypothetical protein